LLEIRLEETGDLHVHTHCCKHHTEVLFWMVSHVFSFH
jgi:hypothetical protein